MDFRPWAERLGRRLREESSDFDEGAPVIPPGGAQSTHGHRIWVTLTSLGQGVSRTETGSAPPRGHTASPRRRRTFEHTSGECLHDVVVVVRHRYPPVFDPLPFRELARNDIEIVEYLEVVEYETKGGD